MELVDLAPQDNPAITLSIKQYKIKYLIIYNHGNEGVGFDTPPRSKAQKIIYNNTQNILDVSGRL